MGHGFLLFGGLCPRTRFCFFGFIIIPLYRNISVRRTTFISCPAASACQGKPPKKRAKEDDLRSSLWPLHPLVCARHPLTAPPDGGWRREAFRADGCRLTDTCKAGGAPPSRWVCSRCRSPAIVPFWGWLDAVDTGGCHPASLRPVGAPSLGGTPRGGGEGGGEEGKFSHFAGGWGTGGVSPLLH